MQFIRVIKSAAFEVVVQFINEFQVIWFHSGLCENFFKLLFEFPGVYSRKRNDDQNGANDKLGNEQIVQIVQVDDKAKAGGNDKKQANDNTQ